MRFILLKILYLTWMIISFLPRMIFSIVYHPIARKLSWKHLPIESEKLGLKYSRSNYKSEFGKISGTISGYKVEVYPDENAKIIVYFHSEKKIKFSTNKNRERPNKRWQKYISTNRNFNAIFRTKLADQTQANKFNSSPELIDQLVNFYLKWMWHLETIYISEKAIYIKMTYGHPFFPYIPASKLETILFDLTNLAKSFDS